MPLIIVTDPNSLTFGDHTYRCALGANGVTDTPQEGDEATPRGRYHLRECWYRADRLAAPETQLPLRIIKPDDGWCDDPAHTAYNRPVKLPFAASHERLWLDDHVYDLIIPIGFNDDPPIAGCGSAIFLHLARPDFSPTLGCVAVALPTLLTILRSLDTASEIVIL
jgi:L,D-peptidoglycan transpeptidase YkuD (ErfK/YbiS/YcfS/YnhG family)